MSTQKGFSEAHQLGYSDAVRYGMKRAICDRPSGCQHKDYQRGYRRGIRNVFPKEAGK